MYRPKTVPRFSFVARSLSQLSITMKAPGHGEAGEGAQRIQTYSSIQSPVSSATIAPDAAKAPKARTWPARRTMRGAK